MAIDRRRLLQYTGASCALAALPTFGSASVALRAFAVQDDLALPRFSKGERVLADTGSGEFSGAGLYLYPAWGTPRVYDVQARAGLLEFRNPGTGQLLWTHSASLDSAFAGRVVAGLEGAAILSAVPELAVPPRPATA